MLTFVICTTGNECTFTSVKSPDLADAPVNTSGLYLLVILNRYANTHSLLFTSLCLLSKVNVNCFE